MSRIDRALSGIQMACGAAILAVSAIHLIQRII